MTNLDWSHVLTNVSERKVAPSPATKLLLAGALDTTLLPEQWVNLVKVWHRPLPLAASTNRLDAF